MLAMLALAHCCLILFFNIVVLSGPVGLCNELGPPVSLLGAVLPLPVYCMLTVCCGNSMFGSIFVLVV